MELHEKLALLRKEKGLTQTELAGEMDITRQAVSRWETGLSIPTTENLTHLSRFYQVPVEYLLNEDAERPLEEKPVPEEGKTARLENIRKWKRRTAAICAAVILVLFFLGVYIGYSIGNARGDDGEIQRSISEMKGEEVDISSAERFTIETGW